MTIAQPIRLANSYPEFLRFTRIDMCIALILIGALKPMAEKGNKHHYAAKSYLRAWADNGKLGEYNRIQNKSQLRGLNQVANKRNFYGYENVKVDGFGSDWLETGLLSEVDSVGKSAEQDKTHLIHYCVEKISELL